MRIVHLVGVNLGAFVMGAAAILAFVLALMRLLAAVYYLFDVDIASLEALFGGFEIVDQPLVLMLVNIVDAALLATIMLVFAFGLKAVFLGKRYKVLAFDIENVDELKGYLIGLVVTLIGTRFLEFILGGERGTTLLESGIAMSFMIVALGLYDRILRINPPSHALGDAVAQGDEE